jgi:peptide-methionine (S)-S-oxide reductase
LSNRSEALASRLEAGAAFVGKSALYPSPLPRIGLTERLGHIFMLKRPTEFLLIVCIALSLAACSVKAASPAPIPAANVDAQLSAVPGKQTAVFAGGCFWGTQSVFERVKGVVKTTVGYAGGSAKTATYDQVTTETTGHAESIEVVYDPSKITYGELLRIFFSVAHDPTQLNRQGPDVGTSYRSAIFYSDDEQKRIATAYIVQLDAAKVFPNPIVTQVTPLKGFYRAEDYHQDYAFHNPTNPYIQVCDVPKIKALKQQFPELFVEYHGK